MTKSYPQIIMPAMTNNFKINLVSGLLEPVNYQFSPHHDERPQGTGIDMIVVHGISLPPGEFGSHAIVAFFCGQLDTGSHPAYADIAALRVSAHLLIRRTGEIIQFVPFSKRAWHAGESSFQGKGRCNDFSIGIELEGTDHVPYEQTQYQQLYQVITLLRQAYPAITQDRIVGHCDIAPGRKTDPGPIFDWDYLKGKLA
jgi:N-acetyl-anhydromuramoyl-L-alanine amidase